MLSENVFYFIFLAGYDGFPNFFDSLMRCIKCQLTNKKMQLNSKGDSAKKKVSSFTKEDDSKPEQDDSGFDTCDSSDERKQRQLVSCTSINRMSTGIISKKTVNRS